MLFLYIIFCEKLSCNVLGNAKDEVKMFNKIRALRNFSSENAYENAYVMLFNHSMETSFLSFKMLTSVFTKSAAELFLPLELKFRRIVTFEQQSIFV